MATKFDDISKAPTDLLSDDYTDKVILKCKKNAGPVAVTIETEQGKDGSLSSKVGTKFSYAKFNVDKGQVKADGGRVLETSLKVHPDIKLSFKASKGADLHVDYVKGNFYGTGVLDVMEMSKISTTACLGLSSGLKLGASADYKLAKSSGLSGFKVGASYTGGPLFAAITADDKYACNIGLLYKVNSDLSLASTTVHTCNKACNVTAIGGAYKAPIGTIKAKMGSNGILHACLIREIAPQVTLTASGSVSPKDLSTFKPGFQISM